MATVRKNITLKEEEVIIFNDYCKKTGQTLSELLRKSTLKFIKEVEEISKDITKINLYDIKDYHTSEIGDFFRLRIGKYRAIFKVDKNIITILVLDIGSRGDIYKK